MKPITSDQLIIPGRLATVRLQDQPLVDAFLEKHRNLTRLRPRVEGVEPTIHEEDMPTLLDGLTVQLILTSDYFRGRVCDAFRRAAEARSVPQFLVQILDGCATSSDKCPPVAGRCTALSGSTEQ
jgi:hypothetical protein